LEDSARTSYQVDPSPGAVEQSELGTGGEDCEGDPGQPDPGADIEDVVGRLHNQGKQQRIGYVAEINPTGFTGSDAPCSNCLIK
jgi:hypothetical protein